MKRFLLAAVVIVGLAIAPVLATTYYVSDCADAGHVTGCYANADITHADCDTAVAGGDDTNPICPDPVGDSSLVYAMYLFDGVGTGTDVNNPEVTAGDTVILCADDTTGHVPCGGTAATIYPKAVGNYYWFCPETGGSVGSPVTISNDAGAIITISGDTDASGGYTSGTDLDNIINGDCGPVEYISWVGVDVGAAKGINFTKTGSRMIYLDDAEGNNWVIDGIDMSKTGGSYGPPNMWTTTDYYTGCFSQLVLDGESGYSPQAHFLYVTDLTADFTIQNSTMHDGCGFGQRMINNYANPHIHITMSGNTYYNLGAADADFNGADRTDLSSYAVYRWVGNTVYDTNGGIGHKSGSEGFIAEDNVIYCTGTRYLSSSLNTDCAGTGIWIGEGDTPGFSHNATIRRNKIYNYGVSRYGNGIEYADTCTGTCTGNTTVIENNMIWNMSSRYPNQFNANAINAKTNLPITIRNNTIFGGNVGLWIEASGTDVPAHVITNNLISNVRPDIGAMHIGPGMPTTYIQNNNLYTPVSTDGVLCLGGGTNCLGGQTYSCNAINTRIGAMNETITETTFPSSNRCLVPSFVDSTNASPALWNLHLLGGDLNDIDKGIDGATEDIDQGTRPVSYGTDIGASEVALCGSFENCSASWTVTATCSGVGSCDVHSPYVRFCDPWPSNVPCTTTSTNYGAECAAIPVSGGNYSLCLPTTNTCALPCNNDAVCTTYGPTGSLCHKFLVGDYNTANVTHLRAAGALTSDTCYYAGPHSGRSLLSIDGISDVGDSFSATTPLTGLITGCTYAIVGFYTGCPNANGIVNPNTFDIQVDAATECSITIDAPVEGIPWSYDTLYNRTWTALPSCDFVAGAATATLGIIGTPGVGQQVGSVSLDDLSIYLVSCP